MKEPDRECGSRLTPKPEIFSAGTLFLVENGVDSAVLSTRLVSSLISLLPADLVFSAAREMSGRPGALTTLKPLPGN